MKIIRIAFKNMINSLAMYRLYLVSMIFSVILFYQFVNFYDHPVLKSIDSLQFVEGLINVALFLMMVFVVFFINFSNGFYIRERQKEIGLYVLMGTTPRKIGLIIAVENFFMFLVATTIGVLSGVLLSKLFLMVIAYTLNLGVTIDFHFSWNAIIWAFGIFMTIGLMMSLKSYGTIRRSSVMKLLKGSEREEKEPKVKVLIGILSIVVIYVGYWFSFTISPDNLVRNFFGAIFFVVIGTFLFYRSVMTMVLKGLLTRKNFVYKRERLVMFSNLWHKIGANYKVYAAVTVFLACTLTAFATSYSFYYGVEDIDTINHPFDITINGTEEVHQQSAEILQELMTSEGVVAQYSATKVQYISEDVQIDIKGAYETTYTSVIEIFPLSEAIRIVEATSFKDQQLITQQVLEEDECLFVIQAGVFMSIHKPKEVMIKNGYQETKMKVLQDINIPLLGATYSDALVVSDEYFDKLIQSYEHSEEVLHEYYMTGYSFENLNFVNEFADTLNELDGVVALPEDDQLMTDSVLIRLFFVIGSFIAIAFIMATGSVIYFKVVSQGQEDVKTFKTLNRLGLERKRIHSIINRQTLMFFVVPYLFAAVHSFFAIRTLEVFMGLNLIWPMIVSFIFIGILFSLYYLITMVKYRNIVLR